MVEYQNEKDKDQSFGENITIQHRTCTRYYTLVFHANCYVNS